LLLKVSGTVHTIANCHVLINQVLSYYDLRLLLLLLLLLELQLLLQTLVISHLW